MMQINGKNYYGISEANSEVGRDSKCTIPWTLAKNHKITVVRDLVHGRTLVEEPDFRILVKHYKEMITRSNAKKEERANRQKNGHVTLTAPSAAIPERMPYFLTACIVLAWTTPQEKGMNNSTFVTAANLLADEMMKPR